MRLTADLKTLDKTSCLNDTNCIIDAITAVLIYLGGRGGGNKANTLTGREENASPIYSKQKTLGRKKIDRFIHQMNKIHF